MNTNIDKIKNLLEQRYKDITEFGFPDHFQTLSPNDKQNLTYGFYNVISYFVHFIYQRPELRGYFLLMLERLENLMKNPRIMEIKKENCAVIKRIVKEFFGRKIKSLLNRLSEEERKLLNPFHKFDEPLAVDYLKYFRLVTNLKKYEELHDLVAGFRWIRNGLLSLCEKIDKQDEKIGDSLMEKLSKEFDLLLKSIYELEQIIKYEPGFISLNSFKEVENIYMMVRPSEKGGILYEFFKSAREFGEIRDNAQVKSLKEDVKKVYQFLSNNLDDKLSKHFIIEKVKSFFEFFVKPQDIKKERELQTEAEKIIFLEGYFPISETHLGSGRLDTLMVNPSDSILIEYKVIGGKSYKGAKAGVERAINDAETQIESYRSIINHYPNLQKEVYILLFCYRHTEVIGKDSFENTPYVIKNGITYYLVTINILGIQPSKIKQKDKLIVNL